MRSCVLLILFNIVQSQVAQQMVVCLFLLSSSNKTMTTEAQLSEITYNSITPIDTGHFHSCNQQKGLPYQILGVETVKSVQIDPQTTKIWLKLNATVWVSLWLLSYYRETELLKTQAFFWQLHLFYYPTFKFSPLFSNIYLT